MIHLTREFRFSLAAPDSDLDRVGNSWSGWYSSNLIAPYLKLQLEVCGKVNPDTGYLCNVKSLDDILRQFSMTAIRSVTPATTYEQLITNAVNEISVALPDDIQFSELRLVVSPTLFYSIDPERSKMVSLTQQFEFSAAHRLHCPEFSDEKNREIFGKCNNPEGHGHNYVVAVTVSRKRKEDVGQVVCMATLEQTVKRLVVDRLDHKHLNRDVPAFSKLNPSVENIAIKIWEWLNDNLEGTQLTNVRVYETPKTWADYSG